MRKVILQMEMDPAAPDTGVIITLPGLDPGSLEGKAVAKSGAEVLPLTREQVDSLVARDARIWLTPQAARVILTSLVSVVLMDFTVQRKTRPADEVGEDPEREVIRNSRLGSRLNGSGSGTPGL